MVCAATTSENLVGARVVVINDKLADHLFPGSDPLEKMIVMNGVPFRVLGIYHNLGSFLGKPNSSSAGNDPRAIVPMEAGVRSLDMWMRRLDLTVKPRANISQTEAIDAVTTTIRVLSKRFSLRM